MAELLPSDLPTLPGRIPADDLQLILQRLQAGCSLLDLANQYGVSKQAMHQRLDRFCISGKADSTLHDAVTEYLTDRLCTQMERQEESTSVLDAVRARDGFNSWKWINERRRAALFGLKQELSVDTKVTVILNQPPPPVTPVIDITPTENMLTSVSAQEVKGKSVE
jgi:hypothetical protein